MPLIRDRSICLRKTEYSETSQIVNLLAREHGVVRAIAKGAHRRTKAGASKFDGGMDFLEVGDAVFTYDVTRELATLTEWSLVEGHPALRLNLRAMYLALYAGELVDRLLEAYDPHPQIFDRLEATLPELGTDRREEAFLAFEMELLKATGYLPELWRCVSCGRNVADDDGPRAYFSPESGSVVCNQCEGIVTDRRSIDARLLRLAQGFARTADLPAADRSLPAVARRYADPVNRLLASHVRQTLGKPLMMERWVLGDV